MKRHLLMTASLAVLYSLAPSAHALNTDDVEPQTLKEYAYTLSANAGNFQRQQLWKATRVAGYFSDTSNTHFTTPQPQVTDLVATVLSRATSVTPYNTTRATYRYDFKQQVGLVSKVAVTALCVDIDWRTLPQEADPEDASNMGSVSLLLARPCP